MRERRGLGLTRVVDQYVHRARFTESLRDGLFLRDIDGDARDVAQCVAFFALHFEPLCIAAHQGDARAGAQQCFRNSGADTAAAASDDGMLSRE